jgi:predicted O-methyltransferase YrrM
MGSQATSVLEIGTHIGASTVHIAAALRSLRQRVLNEEFQLTTVDIADVNDPVNRPWLKFGSPASPRDLVQTIGAAEWTRFVTQRSLDYLRNTPQRSDCIFLDGDHAAKTVYQEIPAALQRLTSGGVILLHDYFPRMQPLWSDGVVEPGPWLATERLRSEGAAFRLLPLGELPWMTKLGSRVTSLALVISGN